MIRRNTLTLITVISLSTNYQNSYTNLCFVVRRCCNHVLDQWCDCKHRYYTHRTHTHQTVVLVSSVCLSQERGCEMCGGFFFNSVQLLPSVHIHTDTHTRTPQTHIKANTCTEMVREGKAFSAPQQIIISVCKYVRVRCWTEIYIRLNVLWNVAALRSHTGDECE